MVGIAGSGGPACLDNVFDFAEDGPVGPPIVPGKPISPGRGTFFDEHVDLHGPEGERLTEQLVEAYDRVEPKQRKRGRDTLRLRLRKLAANALRCHFYRDPAAVLYFRKADAEQYEDKPGWMRHGALAVIVDALAKAGLVGSITGKRMPWHSQTPSWAPAYQATNALIALAEQCGVTVQSVVLRVDPDDLVQLYAPKGDKEFHRHKGGLVHPRKGRRIRFDPTDETRTWTDALEAINGFYRQQHIALGLSPEEQVEWLFRRNGEADRTGADYRLPETLATDVYRVFNNGDETHPRFDEGGRLFGGWWMYISESLRKAITINGQPTVELDYANCHPRMLYHERGIDCPGDLYALPEVEAYERDTGVDPGTYRPCING